MLYDILFFKYINIKLRFYTNYYTFMFPQDVFSRSNLVLNELGHTPHHMNHTASHATPPHTTHHYAPPHHAPLQMCTVTCYLFPQRKYEGRESFIVVDPIYDQAKIMTGRPSYHLFKLTHVLCHATVNLLINTIYTTKFIEEGAILLAVRPLQIEHEVTTDRYFRYIPSVQSCKFTVCSHIAVSNDSKLHPICECRLYDSTFIALM